MVMTRDKIKTILCLVQSYVNARACSGLPTPLKINKGHLVGRTGLSSSLSVWLFLFNQLFFVCKWNNCDVCFLSFTRGMFLIQVCMENQILNKWCFVCFAWPLSSFLSHREGLWGRVHSWIIFMLIAETYVSNCEFGTLLTGTSVLLWRSSGTFP